MMSTIRSISKFLTCMPLAFFLLYGGLILMINTGSSFEQFIGLIMGFAGICFYLRAFDAEPEVSTKGSGYYR